MAMLVLLVEDDEVSISPSTSERLGRLGVTTIELCRDRATTAIVLDGWAFDPSLAELGALVAPGRRSRALASVMRVSVSGR